MGKRSKLEAFPTVRRKMLRQDCAHLCNVTPLPPISMLFQTMLIFFQPPQLQCSTLKWGGEGGASFQKRRNIFYFDGFASFFWGGESSVIINCFQYARARRQTPTRTDACGRTLPLDQKGPLAAGSTDCNGGAH